MKKSTAYTLVFLAGLATGTLVGILYAPGEGKNTRDRLTYILSKYKEKLLEALANINGQEDKYTSQARDQGYKVVSDTKQQAEKLLGDVEHLMNQIKSGK